MFFARPALLGLDLHRCRLGGVACRVGTYSNDLVVVGLASHSGGVGQAGLAGGGNALVSASLGSGAVDLILHSTLHLIPAQGRLTGGGTVGNLQLGCGNRNDGITTVGAVALFKVPVINKFIKS